jgi:hypothetical protein
MLTALLLLATPAPLVPYPPAEKISRRVEVNGVRFRVIFRPNGTVQVRRQATFFPLNIENRNLHRAAVIKASGCQISEEFANGGYYDFKLLCNDVNPAASSTEAQP